MTFVRIYLAAYFILLAGAGLALWQSGVLDRLPGSWLAVSALVAIGLGLLLAAASGSRRVTTDRTEDD
ncbi:MAG TPA: hypothetical protein VFV95_20830 [Vicinamibacterales bacterium]|nr:hypothetical protein [Vicinamibacterales bacterium]